MRKFGVAAGQPDSGEVGLDFFLQELGLFFPGQEAGKEGVFLQFEQVGPFQMEVFGGLADFGRQVGLADDTVVGAQADVEAEVEQAAEGVLGQGGHCAGLDVAGQADFDGNLAVQDVAGQTGRLGGQAEVEVVDELGSVADAAGVANFNGFGNEGNAAFFAGMAGGAQVGAVGDVVGILVQGGRVGFFRAGQVEADHAFGGVFGSQAGDHRAVALVAHGADDQAGIDTEGSLAALQPLEDGLDRLAQAEAPAGVLFGGKTDFGVNNVFLGPGFNSLVGHSFQSALGLQDTDGEPEGFEVFIQVASALAGKNEGLELFDRGTRQGDVLHFGQLEDGLQAQTAVEMVVKFNFWHGFDKLFADHALYFNRTAQKGKTFLFPGSGPILKAMHQHQQSFSNQNFLKSLGFSEIEIHQSFNHYDFRIPHRRILVIGPMGSGKTEFSSRVWRDSLVVKQKSAQVAQVTSSGPADRRNVFFIRSILDEKRFKDYPDDALAYRGGYERMGKNIAKIRDSFDFERLLAAYPEVGTWILDEASFYDERLIYIMREASEKHGLSFIFPTLILNFRKEIFNSSARLLLENATDVFPLTAYCEHPDCVEDSFYTYRYYLVDGEECPAVFFDPLIIVGGDVKTDDPHEPNYCTRCDKHHYLPGKDYIFLELKPLCQAWLRGQTEGFLTELKALALAPDQSRLARCFYQRQYDSAEERTLWLRSLRVPCLAEKALIYLFTEMNLLKEDHLEQLVADLKLDRTYLKDRLRDNGRAMAEDRHETI